MIDRKQDGKEPRNSFELFSYRLLKLRLNCSEILPHPRHRAEDNTESTHELNVLMRLDKVYGDNDSGGGGASD